MSLLKTRVFNLALLLAFAVTMPGVINAQTAMTEIPLGGGWWRGRTDDEFWWRLARR